MREIKKDVLNIQDNEGMTALHWACFLKRPNHTRILTEAGAREDVLDIDRKVCSV